MTIGTIIVIFILAIALGFAIGHTIKGIQGKNNLFTCGGDCSHCAGSCNKTKEEDK